MTAAELLSKLRRLDVKVWADNGDLCCNAPQGTLTIELRAALSEHKTEILALLGHAGSRGQEPPLRRLPREGELPLSFAQQRLWFIDQLEPGSALYNVPTAFRICGRLSVEFLEQSLNEIVRRHEVLRITIKAVEGRPLQKISSSLTVSLPLVDLSDHPEGESEDEALRLINEEARRPFELADGPLLRTLLVRLAAEHHILLLTLHHIVCDGWSMNVLFRELGTLYEAFSRGRPSPLPELAIQYLDFARWQRQWLRGEVLRRQVAYWKEKFADLPVVQLPADRPRPAVQSYRGARQSIVLENGLCEALKAFSQKERVSQFMTLLAAFNVLLCRYSGQQDIVVGTAIAGRNRVEIEPLIGFFVNTLVLRTDLTGDCIFRDLAHRVRNAALDAYAYQDLPFEKLVEELAPKRNLSYSPLFQVMMVFQNEAAEPLELSGLDVTTVQIGSSMAKFDLSLHVAMITQGLAAAVTYNTDLFDSETIARMLGHFRTLLEGIVADPNRRIWELPILSEAERHQLLVEWNDTQKEYSKDKCVHELFEAQVERTPDAVAIVFQDRQLTYRELNRRANQLAQYLRRHGVGPEVLVGICMSRSLEMVVGLLGILKAGGAYVSLDPSYPKERLALILEDSGAAVLLTEERFASAVPEHKARVIRLDTEEGAIAREPEQNLAVELGADQLAYVIYTSGSTGKPKGVAIAHRNTATLIHWAKEFLTTEDIAGVLASTSICFDLSVFEIFVPLSWGGKVIIAENALELSTLSAAHEVTLINTVPSAMKEVLELGGVPLSVHKVCLAGEPLTTELVRRLYRQPSVRSVVDLYGPSEDTTYSTYAVRDAGGPATIGRPIANTQIYLLDQYHNPLPVGVPGELYIGGDGLARGYLNRPELTAERFLPNPFSNRPGERLYRTGDLARYRPDGNIELIGRNDSQVKIRGYRIELGEIEAVLRAHPQIREAVVLAREDSPGEKRLIAYVIPDLEKLPSHGELGKFLRSKLPDFMCPSAFVFLNAWPLTPNGKLNRKELPLPEGGGPVENEFIAPRTQDEQALASIWSEVLKVERVGVHDNFFDLGGHSLIATRVVARMRAVFGLDFPVRILFENSTIAELALKITEAQRQPATIEHLLIDVESLSEEQAQDLLLSRGNHEEQ